MDIEYFGSNIYWKFLPLTVLHYISIPDINMHPKFFLISSSLAYMDRISISLNRNDMKIISATEHFVILGEIVVRVVVVVVVVDDAGGISKKN